MESETISSALRMAGIIVVVNTVIIYLMVMNGQTMIVNRKDEDQFFNVIGRIGAVKDKEKNGRIKYRLSSRIWPFNSIRINKSGYYNINVSTNFKTLKQIQDEMAKEDLL